MLQGLNHTDAVYGSALGELAARINRIEQDRAACSRMRSRLQRLEDHLDAVDQRLLAVEDSFRAGSPRRRAAA
jgi:hypothetical protein